MADTANDQWVKWHSEIEQSVKVKGYSRWETRSKKIVERYRDERNQGVDDANTNDGVVNTSKFNIIWSNVQTLKPALFGKTPKPVVERRYLDRDDVGRTASVILERALLYELDNGYYYSAIGKAVLDRLLPGRGTVWVRYEPKFQPMPSKTQETDAEEKAETVDDQDEEPKELAEEPQEEVVDESTCVDYVQWTDFRHSPARVWEEVWWVAKRVYMSRKELIARFGTDLGEKVTLDWVPPQAQKVTDSEGLETEDQKRARVWEIWDKIDRKVRWLAEGYQDSLLDEVDDPLKLEDFWPCPKPLYSTLTNETLVPVPDPYEYWDQATELDDLTSRITALTKSIKACGIYDASQPELKRMFEEGFENQLVPCDNMAEFASKAGSNGMGHLWLLPVMEMAQTLNELYKAREAVKQSLYEITGISDIVRGQASGGGDVTATEQRIKGQFASMRLNDMQGEVARFSRDVLRIMGEIISEHYDPMTLFQISGFEQYAKEQWPVESFSSPMMGHNGGPPLGQPPQAPPASPFPGAGAPQPGMIPGGMQPPALPPELQAQQKAAEMFKAAVELLKNDKLRGFRIDIETDSLIEVDQQQTQESRTQLLQAISQFLPQAIEAGQMVPELKPLMARLLMFFLRGFKASRDIESAFGQFIDDVTKDAAQPQQKPPSPEEIKAQSEQMKMQMQGQQMQQQAQLDQQKAQLDLQTATQKAQIEIQKANADLDIKRQELALEQQRMAMKAQELQMIYGAKAQEVQLNAAANEHKAAIDAHTIERKHEIGLETMQAKSDMVKKG